MEGHEPSILRGIDWDRLTIDYILCEQGCDEALRARGYHWYRLPSRSYYAPNSVELLWVHPRIPPVQWKKPPVQWKDTARALARVYGE